MPKKKFKCDICNKEFTDRYYLASHQYVHTTDTPFTCPQCPYTGKTKKYLARHIKKVHTEKTGEHKCNVCGKLFHHRSSMKVHAMVHTGEKPHSCKVCGKTFRVTYSLNSHMLIHTNEKPFQCSFCDYACRDSSTLRKHQYKHMGLQKSYECNICDKGYSTLAKLKVHIAEQHLNIDVKKYPCDQCSKVFKASAHRKRHIDSVHKRTLVCTCPICGRRLMSKNNLPKHMRTHLEERPFSCTHSGCGIAFKDKSSLKKHIVIHAAPTHACSHCGRKFARKSHVQYHEKVMHLERTRSVECDYCGSRFYSKNYLLKHIQTKHVYKHEFKYICDICGLVTHNKPSIVMHLKYGHSNDHDMQCKICDNKIIYKKHLYLKMHYWKTHNIRYKITRKATNSMAARKERQEKAISEGVEVKVEPIEDYEEIPLMDVGKFEQEEEDECSEYSRRVLAEDMTFAHGPRALQTDFDACFVRRVVGERRVNTREVNTDGINEEQEQSVKRRIKQIITTTNKIEKARALRERLKKEQKLIRENEKRDAQLKADRRREEMIELVRVREMYNEKMKAALAKQKEKKDKVKIKYFKIPENSSNKNNKISKDIPETCTELSNNDTPIEDNIPKSNEINLISEGNGDVAKENDDTVLSNDMVHSDDENHHKNNKINITNEGNGDFSTINVDTVYFDDGNHYSNNEDEEINKTTEGVDDFSKVNGGTVLSDDEEHHSNGKNDDINQTNEKISDFSKKKYDTADTDDENHNENETNQTTEGMRDLSKGMVDTVHSNNVNHQNNEINGNNEVFDFDKENDTVQANDENDSTKDISKKLDKNDSNELIHNKSSEYHGYEATDSDLTTDDTLDQSLLERRVKKRGIKSNKVLRRNDSGKAKKMEFKTHQCYVCFKLYETKEAVMSHCQEHFDVCHSVTLSKCPVCGHVSHKGISQHLKLKHDISLKVPIHKMKRTEGTFPYSCDANGTKVELIPSVRILNKVASDTIDKKKREMNDQAIAKPKLVKIKNEWIVAKESVPIEFDEIPEMSDRDMHKLNICDNDVDRLGQLSRFARIKGLRMMYPCFKCDKICQTFSALKLHKRRHEDNPTPFKARVKKTNKKVEKKVIKLNTANRTAFPKAILNKHKCDAKLKEFYESNIRGGDIEFWQFLKIYNKMNREKIEDFKDLENRSDFGNHFDYYKDVAGTAGEK